MSTSDRPTVIFLHVGKTAGATMRRALRREFRRVEVMEVRAPAVAPGRLRRDGAVAWFGSLPEADRARPRLIMGHMTYGLHEFVPRPSGYVTLLREPIALVRSQYHHVRRHEGHLLHEQAKAHPDLTSYIESGLSLEMDNSQTRAFAGDTTTPFGSCTPEMLERAKDHLRRFEVAGLTERFDESLVAMIRAFGWKRVRYVTTNVDPHRSSRAPLTDRELAVVRDRNALDLELYTWASERFRREVVEAEGFADALAAFREENRRYGPIGRLAALPRASVARLRTR
jgi:Galactose-3-O-sulfotransferase